MQSHPFSPAVGVIARDAGAAVQTLVKVMADPASGGSPKAQAAVGLMLRGSEALNRMRLGW